MNFDAQNLVNAEGWISVERRLLNCFVDGRYGEAAEIMDRLEGIHHRRKGVRKTYQRFAEIAINDLLRISYALTRGQHEKWLLITRALCLCIHQITFIKRIMKAKSVLLNFRDTLASMLSLPARSYNENTAGAIAYIIKFLSYCVYGSKESDDNTEIWMEAFLHFNFDTLISMIRRLLQL